MKSDHIFVLLALAIAPCAAATAEAHTYGLTCTNSGSDNFEGALTGTAAWTSIDGGAGGTVTVTPGDIVELTGICQGDIVLTKNGAPISGITIANSAGNNTVGSDGINGQVEANNVALTLTGLVLESGQSGATIGVTDLANVYAHDGASLTLDGDTVGPGPLIGIFVTRASSAQLFNGLNITGVGTQGSAKENDGLRLDAASSAVLTRISGSGPSIFGNGGNGVTLLAGSSLQFFNGTVHDNGGAEIYATGASTVTLGGVGVETSSTTTTQPLIQVFGGSSATIDTGSVVRNTGGGTSAAALLAASASSIVLNTTTISMTGVSLPVIEASGDSSIILAGGNNLSASSGGTLFQIDHSSSLQQVAPSALGYIAAPDAATGSAFVQVQSSMDIGVGVAPNTSTPSLTWSVPAGNCILVQQNSSFRVSGGILIAGAPPAVCALNGNNSSTTIVIQQESNAFFNLGEGGTDAFSGGGGVSCVFTSFPNAHVNGKGNISPPSAQPAMIGTWSAASTATSPGCLGP